MGNWYKNIKTASFKKRLINFLAGLGIGLSALPALLLLVDRGTIDINQPPTEKDKQAIVTEQNKQATPSSQENIAPRNMNNLFDALWFVESSSRLNPPDGDNGRSIGPYQIQLAYWTDANMPNGTYQNCRNKEYAEEVMQRYWQRYAPEALRTLDFETLARIHNGGPNGHRKEATISYWNRVEQNLN